MRYLIPQFIMLFLFLVVSAGICADSGQDEYSLDSNAIQYENKEYATDEEFIRAVKEGRCSTVWYWMHLDKAAKITLVDQLKREFRQQSGVMIGKSPEFYVNELDYLIAKTPNSENQKLGVMFKTVAVMAYDFDEGIDREETAKRWLGSYYSDFKAIKKNTR